MTKQQQIEQLEAQAEADFGYRQTLLAEIQRLKKQLAELTEQRKNVARDAHTKLVLSVAQMNEAIARTIVEVGLG
jgi:seryl-tRNA synthetase